MSARTVAGMIYGFAPVEEDKMKGKMRKFYSVGSKTLHPQRDFC
jgi:hypothetical protein